MIKVLLQLLIPKMIVFFLYTDTYLVSLKNFKAICTKRYMEYLGSKNIIIM